jgi:alpha-beta hydrolase superfamily lysophospholipase
MKRKKIAIGLLGIILMLFLTINIVAYFHAYKFTHYSNDKIVKTKEASLLSSADKFETLIFGINNPRPKNNVLPSQSFDTIQLQSNKKIECWLIKTDSAIGTVILFHGFSGQKSSMIDKSDEFLKLGYNTMLVDFMGSGNSEGNQTTIGYHEAEEVKTCFDYIRQRGESNIVLFGTSMGAVAILKSIHDYGIMPQSIIIECPYGTMYQTVCNRFKSLGLPTFPMAGILTFWGGVQNGFWAFGMKPIEYAKSVRSPTLLLFGELDKKVNREEIDAIFNNLSEPKKLKLYPLAGHENYLNQYKSDWVLDIATFLKLDKSIP